MNIYGKWLEIDAVSTLESDNFVSYHVKLQDGRTGWIGYEGDFEDSDPVVAAAKAKAQREATAAKAQAECEAAGQPKIGMTYEQAVATCWGKPQAINRTTVADHVQEQAIYSTPRFLNFTHGVLTSIQETTLPH